jgi:Holliday junction resolvase RusA-like endonuclease
MSDIANVDLFEGRDPFSPVVLAHKPQLDGGTWTLQIPGEPIAKGRPKLGIVAGHAHAYTPKRTRSYEDIIRATAVREWNRPLIAERPIWLRATFVRGIPASWSIKKRNAAVAGTLHPIGRPDLDNFWKACVDAMNGVVFLDDSLIVETTARKVYGHIPHIVVTLTW